MELFRVRLPTAIQKYFLKINLKRKTMKLFCKNIKTEIESKLNDEYQFLLAGLYGELNSLPRIYKRDMKVIIDNYSKKILKSE